MARRPGVKKAKRATAGKPRARAPKRAAPRRAVKPAAKRPATGKKATSSKRPAAANPLLIEVTRGEMVESRHRVAIAIVDARGKTVESWGDIGRPIYALEIELVITAGRATLEQALSMAVAPLTVKTHSDATQMHA